MLTKNYEISKTTCALIPNENFSTKIIEGSEILCIPSPINKVIEYSCSYYGSSFKGRLEGSKCALGSKYKLPIIIEETREIIFFPTSSYESQNCSWISLKNISDYKNEENKVKVIFNNGLSLKLNMSYSSFENQVLRATKLLLILKSRKNN